MENISKIVWHEPTGTVYWVDQDEYICFAPMNKDNTADLDDGGIVELWENQETKDEINNLLGYVDTAEVEL